MSVEKMLFGKPSYQMLRAALDAAALRQRIVADNIANAETPGFTAREVRFEELLNQAASGEPALPMTPSSGGLSLASAGGAIPRPQVVAAGSTNAIGGAPGEFDMERAMADLNENKVQYQALVTMISGRLMNLKNAIESK